MPVNAPPEYMKAEERFKSAKTREEKIAALEEMIRLLPRHHGSESAHAQLKSRLAKLKKETTKKGARAAGITKEGEAQVCIVGFTKSGKSTLLAELTASKPAISPHPYTTTKPELGMMDYKGVKIQMIEIPSTFDPRYMSIARTADLIVLTSPQGEEKNIEDVMENNYVRTRHIVVDPLFDDSVLVKEKIWSALGLIIAYTKKLDYTTRRHKLSPMALPKNSTVKDFAERIHKDFIKDFRFARVYRKNRTVQAGLNYPLQDGDVVELHLK
ncbi:MAG: TGS domain-containing protein [Candidatus Aenigmarchaeota archaeon]|nr:TGS domain-containing protein [Candidatus Aenigmarchaeota archaeon]